MFKLWIETDNAAFEDDPYMEIARILRVAAAKLEDGFTSFALLDANGNEVGDFMYRDALRGVNTPKVP